MDRRDFIQSISLVTLGLLAPISNVMIEAPANAQAVFISRISKEIKNGYSKITGGEIFADIYGFSTKSNKFDKIIFKDNFQLQKDEPFHIIHSEYVVDDDGEKVCFTSSIKNVLITNYKQVGENVFVDVNYDINPSVTKRLEYNFEIKANKRHKHKEYTVKNSNIKYSIGL